MPEVVLATEAAIGRTPPSLAGWDSSGSPWPDVGRAQAVRAAGNWFSPLLVLRGPPDAAAVALGAGGMGLAGHVDDAGVRAGGGRGG